MQEDRILILSKTAGTHVDDDAWFIEFNAGLAEAGMPLSTLNHFADETWPPRIDGNACGMVVFPSEDAAPENALAEATRDVMKQADGQDLPIVVLSDHQPRAVSAGARHPRSEARSKDLPSLPRRLSP